MRLENPVRAGEAARHPGAVTDLAPDHGPPNAEHRRLRGSACVSPRSLFGGSRPWDLWLIQHEVPGGARKGSGGVWGRGGGQSAVKGRWFCGST
jgi:hypothetical protein